MTRCASGTGTADIVIIGAGLAGTAAAYVLANAGYDVVLTDTRSVFPSSFRAEKITKAQMALFDRLGFGATVRACAVPYSHVTVASAGAIYREKTVHEYGMSYSALIASLRSVLPPSVRWITGEVTDASAQGDLQRIVLDGKTLIEARLVIVATGTGQAMQAKLGMERQFVSPRHSLNFGFNVAPPPGGFPFESLSYYGNGIEDRVAYLTLFRGKDGMRANFYCYRDAGDIWAKQFFKTPAETIMSTLPGLEKVAGRFEVSGPVSVRSVDLYRTAGYRRAGVVLIGDAFSTCCPVVGLGLSKVLTDVDRLCTGFIPEWLRSPGMSHAKISAFYDDPVKRQSDVLAWRLSLITKSMATNRSHTWAIRRQANTLMRQGLRALYRVKPGLTPGPKTLLRPRTALADGQE